MKHCVITLPTLNEADNIIIIIEKIFSVVPYTDILVIDDNSQDGTADLVESHHAFNKKLFLIRRTQNIGRGYAGKDGFIWALEQKYRIIIEMDADLSHDPVYINALIHASHNCDFVIGSRFIAYGNDHRCNISRNILSICANFYIRKILGIQNIHDCTSGFRLFKHYVLESLPVTELTSSGPSIVEEILYKALQKGYHCNEVPIEFKSRNAGHSKLDIRKLLTVLWFIITLRIKGR